MATSSMAMISADSLRSIFQYVPFRKTDTLHDHQGSGAMVTLSHPVREVCRRWRDTYDTAIYSLSSPSQQIPWAASAIHVVEVQTGRKRAEFRAADLRLVSEFLALYVHWQKTGNSEFNKSEHTLNLSHSTFHNCATQILGSTNLSKEFDHLRPAPDAYPSLKDLHEADHQRALFARVTELTVLARSAQLEVGPARRVAAIPLEVLLCKNLQSVKLLTDHPCMTIPEWFKRFPKLRSMVCKGKLDGKEVEALQKLCNERKVQITTVGNPEVIQGRLGKHHIFIRPGVTRRSFILEGPELSTELFSSFQRLHARVALTVVSLVWSTVQGILPETFSLSE